ncbi:hypothetical protein BDW74DRAFT_107162 [Aspergillus multicolor]|uniref:uncharacterized protein n=1 Tax=Aspergillus multicolor TaxID=41759 RepID=UPI003CCE1C00
MCCCAVGCILPGPWDTLFGNLNTFSCRSEVCLLTVLLMSVLVSILTTQLVETFSKLPFRSPAAYLASNIEAGLFCRLIFTKSLSQIHAVIGLPPNRYSVFCIRPLGSDRVVLIPSIIKHNQQT